MSSPIEVTDRFLRENSLNRIDFHGTDYAWGFRENEPIIALIAKRDREAAFRAAMELYWGSAEYIPKPWCLFIVVEDIAPHHRQMLDNLAKQYNIQVISGASLLEAVKEQLQVLLQILKTYIPTDSENAMMSLGESIKGWKKEKPAHETSYRVEVETGNLEVYMENGVLVPSRKTIPLTIQSGEKSIDGILPRLVDVENGLFFDTEHRNLPMVFRLFIDKEARLVLRFEADKGNIVEAASFWGIFQSFTDTKRLAFIEQNTGDILFSCRRELDERGNR